MYIEKNLLGAKKTFLFLLISIILASCGQKSTINENSLANIQETEVSAIEKISVTSSIIPLSSVINSIGGDYVEVNNIVPAGVSPHGFDISAKQMVQIEKSEIVFLTGLEHIDGFLEKAVAEKKQIHLADGIELIESSGHDDHEEVGHNDHEEDERNEEEHDEETHDTDPHVWLGKENIILIVDRVRKELSVIMPEHAEYFSINTESFKRELEKMYSVFESQTIGKNPKEFIVFHDAYNYLMQSAKIDLNLKVPFSENVLHETGTAHMAELVEEVEKHGVKHIFKEPQFNEGNIQRFVDEYSLEMGTLDPIGTDPSANGYLNNIKSNLTAISKIYE